MLENTTIVNLIAEARTLHSEDGHPEYDRALVELCLRAAGGVSDEIEQIETLVVGS